MNVFKIHSKKQKWFCSHWKFIMFIWGSLPKGFGTQYNRPNYRFGYLLKLIDFRFQLLFWSCSFWTLIQYWPCRMAHSWIYFSLMYSKSICIMSSSPQASPTFLKDELAGTRRSLLQIFTTSIMHLIWDKSPLHEPASLENVFKNIQQIKAFLFLRMVLAVCIPKMSRKLVHDTHMLINEAEIVPDLLSLSFSRW